jgi:hypothetical protein
MASSTPGSHGLNKIAFVEYIRKLSCKFQLVWAEEEEGFRNISYIITCKTVPYNGLTRPPGTMI